MSNKNGLPAIRVSIALGVSALVLSGCLGPTYGTDKTATEQLLGDVTNAVRLRGDRPQAISYNPRPGLVQPTDTSTLPQPQQNIAETSDAWPESPEERLARIRAEADEGNVQAGLAGTTGSAAASRFPDQQIGASPRDRGDTPIETASRKQADKKRREETVAARAAPARRVYLTDPPVDYRQPADTAAYGDLGETEATKERKRKKATADPKGGWKRLVPWL